MANPRLTRALNDALLLYRTGRVAEACHKGEQIVRRNPKDADALHFLGMVQLRMGQMDQAASSLSKSNKRRPGDPHILTKLAAARVFQGRFDDAETHYNHALRIRSNYEPAIWGKAELYEKLGRTSEGLAVIQPLMESGHADSQAAIVCANLYLQASRPDEAIKLAEKTLAADQRTKPESTRRLHLICGKAHEKNERYDDAFASYIKANEAAAQPFNPTLHTRDVDRLIATLTPEAWKTLARSNSASERSVFVLGFPQCGSTLVEQIIATHPEAVGVGEIPALPALIGGLSARFRCKADYPECVTELNRQDLDQLTQTYVAEVQSAAHQPAERYVDKMLNNYFNIGLIGMMMPGASIIHVRRDPLDTCLSCFINLRSPSHTYASNLKHLGFAYRQYERIMEHWRTALSIPMLEVQYEDLVANQEAETRKIIEYCGLSWNDECLRFHESGRSVTTLSYDQVRKPMYQSSVKNWTRYEKQLEPLRAALDGVGI